MAFEGQICKSILNETSRLTSFWHFRRNQIYNISCMQKAISCKELGVDEPLIPIN